MKIQSQDTTQSPYRFALYWAPSAGSVLATLGAAWLGRAGTSDTERPVVPGFAADRLAQLTESPRHYGLHGTLKPPFILAEGCDAGQLATAVDAFARETAPVMLPPLQLRLLDGFLALTPAEPCPALDAFAARCVMDFDLFRRPAPAAELARRRAAGLSASQEANLLRWGYPYVLDSFRFHVTLTDRLDPTEAEQLLPALSAFFAPVIGKPVTIEDIALFVQPREGASFVEQQRFRLDGAA